MAVKHLQARMARLKVEGWLKAAVEGRRLRLQVEAAALGQASRLDGCYVIKTDLPQAAADAQTVHDRYKDLAHVEQAFRTCKTALLEMRPWFVRIEKSTRGHALVVMLAYLIVRQLAKAWAALDLTVEEGLRQLSTLCTMQMTVKGGAACHCLPTPRPASAELLRAAEIELPQSLPCLGARVVTRKKLQEQRVTP
ncbi:MAG: hypothetical protein HY232_06135 [Acidobacteria bacterium]|nr:hypothetical protein [Acidobacteriota bacterium]